MMRSFISNLNVDIRAISPARVFAGLSALGSALIGFAYLIGSDKILGATDLYVGLQNFNAVRAFGAWTLFCGGMLLVGAVINRRSWVALWSFQNILIWLFAGALFASQLPDSWFTFAAIWVVTFSGALYTRFLAAYPPTVEDERFDEHVDRNRVRVLE